jgi:gas vesicle protein
MLSDEKVGPVRIKFKEPSHDDRERTAIWIMKSTACNEIQAYKKEDQFGKTDFLACIEIMHLSGCSEMDAYISCRGKPILFDSRTRTGALTKFLQEQKGAIDSLIDEEQTKCHEKEQEDVKNKIDSICEYARRSGVTKHDKDSLNSMLTFLRESKCISVKFRAKRSKYSKAADEIIQKARDLLDDKPDKPDKAELKKQQPEFWETLASIVAEKKRVVSMLQKGQFFRHYLGAKLVKEGESFVAKGLRLEMSLDEPGEEARCSLCGSK